MRIGLSIEKNRITSVVVNNNGMIVHSEKSQMNGGLSATLKNNLERLVEFRRHEISHIFIGTDFVRFLVKHHTNYTPVGVIRIAGHKPDILMPCFNWPEELKENVLVGHETIDGGHDYDGRVITHLSKEQVIEATQRLIDKGAQCIVLCGVFSTFYQNHEISAERIIRENFKVDVLPCYELGTVGFMERENFGILNATFRRAFSEKVYEIERILKELKLSCEVYFTQTNGTILSLEKAALFPFLTIDSSLINAFSGALKLTQYQDCCAIYMDEMGSYGMVLQDGAVFSPAANNEITFDDFCIPGLHTRNIGLRSVVTIDQLRITIGGPCEIMGSKDIFTLESAMRICNGLTNFDEKVDIITAYRVVKEAEKMLIDFYQLINSRGLKGPLILIGPAATLFPQHETVIVAPFSVFASAYGAAMQGITCCITKTMQLTSQEKQLTELCDEVVKQVHAMRGHDPKIVFFDVQPYRYLPEDWAQVTVVATGQAVAPRSSQPETLQELISSNIYSGALENPISYSSFLIEEQEQVV